MRTKVLCVWCVSLVNVTASCNEKVPPSKTAEVKAASAPAMTGDDCERAGSKLFGAKSVAAEVYEYEHQPGKIRPPAGKRQADWIAECQQDQRATTIPPRERTTTSEMTHGLVAYARRNVDCILGASSDDEVYNCFVRYMKEPPPPESTVILNQISALASDAYRRTGSFPVGTAPLTPANTPCPSRANKAEWSHATWQALAFRNDDPLFLQYSYTSDGKSFRAQAMRGHCDPVGSFDHVSYVVSRKVAGSVSGEIVGGEVKTTFDEPQRTQ